MSAPPIIPFRFVSGTGNEFHQQQINQLAPLGYRVISMIYDESAIGSNKQVVVLMALTGFIS